MIDLDFSLLEDAPRFRSPRDSSEPRFSLVAVGAATPREVPTSKMQLEIHLPNKFLADKLNVNPEDPEFRLQIAYLSAANSEKVGLENVRHVVLRPSPNNTVGLKARKKSGTTSSFKLQTYDLLKDGIEKIKGELAGDLHLEQAPGALIFQLPEFANGSDELETGTSPTPED